MAKIRFMEKYCAFAWGSFYYPNFHRIIFDFNIEEMHSIAYSNPDYFVIK